MTRWNIDAIFFLGVSGQHRVVRLLAGVNIITGASGTGKSTLIKAIDYCLGSSKCELPIHVRRRALAVGVKWVRGEDEFIVARLIPSAGTSSRMFVSGGRKLALPKVVTDLDGATTIDAAKAFLERQFGIGDPGGEPGSTGKERGRATVRHITPYLFVTKEVIDSESVLLHGMEKAEKVQGITETMPYFLRASDEASAIDERRLRQLQRALEKEEKLQATRAAADSQLKQRALSLLTEALRIGLAKEIPKNASESELVACLEVLVETELGATVYPNEGELSALHVRRRTALDRLGDTRKQLQATRAAVRDASGFQSAVGRQREKLRLAEHFKLDADSGVCPICDAPSSRGRESAEALQAALRKISDESAAIERTRPRLTEHERALDKQVEELNSELRHVDDAIKTWLRQNDESRRLTDLAQLQAHLLGRISYFIDVIKHEPRQRVRDLGVLRDEIRDLEGRVDREAMAIKLRHAESKISEAASEILAVLPTVAPCVGAELQFSSKQPAISLIEPEENAVLRLPDVGSDQNYLAIHLALAFALQRYLDKVKAPVPGLLVLDQISRPYYPATGDDVDEQEVVEEDEDAAAMRKHLDFIFGETARQSGLQVLLIEHAFFAKDQRYVSATRERWKRSSRKALIPIDWPIRTSAEH